METTNDYFFGVDLLFKTVERDIQRKADVLVVLAHFIIVKQCKFPCIGVGEDKNLAEDEVGSELLPDGWNEDLHKYALRYANGKQLYLLLGHISDNLLILNFLNVQTKKVSNVALDPHELVKQTKGKIKELIPTASEIMDRFRRELINPVVDSNTVETNTQTTPVETDNERARFSSLRDDRRNRHPRYPVPPPSFGPNFNPSPDLGIPGVGRGDLDPLARGGPGNLFPFPSHPNIPFGGGPLPQPRYDPIGPDPNRLPPNPNPDHFRPPHNDYDDFYM